MSNKYENMAREIEVIYTGNFCDRNLTAGASFIAEKLKKFFPDPAWKPIKTAPWDREVLLTGKSGYIPPHDVFIVNGYRVPRWHGGLWNDATGTLLLERGWNPTHWMEKPEEPK